MRKVIISLEQFKKITGLNGVDFCKKTGCNYQELQRSLNRGYCILHGYQRGDNKHQLYNIYSGIIARCYNRNEPAYKNYGGRGIRMSGEFFYSFKAFAEYMGERPGPEYSIDRIDNDGNYERGNLRWATRREQSINKRIQRNNKTGHKNIQIKGRKYLASIRFNKQLYLCQRYLDINNAIASREILKYRLENSMYS